MVDFKIFCGPAEMAGAEFGNILLASLGYPFPLIPFFR
jgi:hypothetical protein